ncbi:hypothetical protein CK203_012089 [Vitis vinifera]|uniref:Retrotransposon gag domain-containing protein n=1 Tax=Vitis vinifera TaxID=29760 RepID=A0A438K0X0_VITVI|nr:hypothetical protein CK203_012089 [Vitis vinifera]
MRRAFTIKKPHGNARNACVEVMTTLHGSTPSLSRRAEGCVPPEDPIKTSFLHVGAFVDLRAALVTIEIRLSLPQSPFGVIREGGFTLIDLDSPLWIRVGSRLTREAIANLGQRIDGQQTRRSQFRRAPSSIPSTSHHLHQSVSTTATPFTLHSQIEERVRGFEQRPEESVTSFISRWREKISQIIDRPSEKDQISMIMRSLQPRFARHLMGFPHTDFGSLEQALYGIEEGIARGLWPSLPLLILRGRTFRRTKIRRCWCYQFNRDETS